MSNEELKQNERGFYQYGKVEGAYGEEIEVTESSAAMGPHCLLSIQAETWLDPTKKRDDYQPANGMFLYSDVMATAHLNPEQAKAVIARLQTWLDQIPERWPEHKTG